MYASCISCKYSTTPQSPLAISTTIDIIKLTIEHFKQHVAFTNINASTLPVRIGSDELLNPPTHIDYGLSYEPRPVSLPQHNRKPTPITTVNKLSATILFGHKPSKSHLTHIFRPTITGHKKKSRCFCSQQNKLHYC